MIGVRAGAMLLAAVLAAAATAQGNGSDWLILQSAADPLALVGTAAAKRAPGARVTATDDCPGMRPGFYVLATRPGGGPRPAGAYVRRCTPGRAASPRWDCRQSIPALPRCEVRRSISTVATS